jgi:glycosyltransferase involved in cell wall biosynthesis
MRIIEVLEPPHGGVAEHVAQLTLGLRERGLEVEIAGPPESHIYPRLAEAGVPVHRLPYPRDYRHPWHDAGAARRLSALLGRGEFDLVHCHSSKAGAIGRAAAALHGVPTIYSPHGFGFVGEVSALRQLIVPRAERLLSHFSSRIVCVSQDEHRIALQRRIAKRARLVAIPHGVPAPDALPGDRATVEAHARLRALASGGPLIGAVATLRREKRLDLFLRAAATVLQREPRARVALIGSGPLEQNLRQLAGELGLDTHARFALLPFEPPVDRYLAALDGFVLCSDWEAFPIALLEALAWGVPQVASEVGGVPEIVTPQTGILVPPSDPEALAGAMLELARDPARRSTMSAASRARHQQHFTLERMLDRIAELYRLVIDERRVAARQPLSQPTAAPYRVRAEET